MSLWTLHLRLTFRRLRRQPLFAGAAIAILALGLGATATLFAVVDAVLLKPMPYSEANRIFKLSAFDPSQGESLNFTASELRQLRERLESFGSTTGIRFTSFNLTGTETPEQVRAARVHPQFFEVLGVAPNRGRALDDDDTLADAAVIKHDLWQRQLGARPDAVGETIQLNGRPFLVVGVMPPTFDFPDWADLLIPTGELVDDGSDLQWQLLGRLAPDATPPSLLAEIATRQDVLAQRTAEADQPFQLRAVSLLDDALGEHRGSLWVMTAAVVALLLIVCLELATLQALRSLARRRELAVRRALGAGRGQLTVDLALESLVLSLVGGALGLVVAWWCLDLVVALAPTEVPRLAEAAIDWRAVAFALAISLLCGFMVGLLPALGASGSSLRQALQSGRSVGAGGSGSLRNVFVVAQVAVTLTLLSAAGLLVRSYDQLDSIDPGFDPSKVANIGMVLPPDRYPKVADRTAFVERVQAELRAVPGLLDASATNYQPLTFVQPGWPSYEIPALGEVPATEVAALPLIAAPGFFSTLGVPRLAGRDFGWQDDGSSPSVVIVNRTFAERAWPSEAGSLTEVPGRRIVSGEQSFEVVGVVADLVQGGPGSETPPTLYIPYAQQAWSYLNLMVRTDGKASERLEDIRQAVWKVDPNRPLFQVISLETIRQSHLRQPAFRALLVTLFSAVALILAAVGLYSVLAFAVSQRRREIGVRLTLGAARGHIRRLVIRQGMSMVALGMLFGGAGILLTGRFLQSLLYGVGHMDVPTHLGVVAIFLAAAYGATSLPADRASRLDPNQVLREE